LIVASIFWHQVVKYKVELEVTAYIIWIYYAKDYIMYIVSKRLLLLPSLIFIAGLELIITLWFGDDFGHVQTADGRKDCNKFLHDFLDLCGGR
jgi:hypothetical protein